MQLNLNDTDIFFVNRDFAFYLSLFVIICSLYKYAKHHQLSIVAHPVLQRMINFFGISLWEIIIVLVIRGFFFELYFIPSGSMQPSLYPGDIVLVNKFAYGVKVPGTNSFLKEVGHPQRGDVAVFLQPDLPTQRKMIKRVIGLPGDKIQIENQVIKINGQALPLELDHQGFEYIPLAGYPQKIRVETLFYRQILDSRSIVVESIPSIQRPFSLDFEVPEGHYFVLGDNRDNSQDSRYWGFVPERFLSGKAQYVIFSFGSKEKSFTTERIGKIA